MMLFISYEGHASHYRYGNISWSRASDNSRTISVTFTSAWRKTFNASFNAVTVGGTINLNQPLYFGDGLNSGNMVATVTAINNTDNWFYCTYTVSHTYAGAGTSYILSIGSTCCRLITTNNSDQVNFRSESLVKLTTGNFGSPVSTLAPIINLRVGQTAATFSVPATDPDGTALTYAAPTSAQMGGTGTLSFAWVEPTGFAVSSTGVCTFNTVGKTLDSVYNAAVLVTDAAGSTTIVDVLLKMVANDTPPIFDYLITPSNNFVYSINPGQNVSFGVKASDVDNGSTVTLSAVGLPTANYTFTPDLPETANPVSTNFSFTPDASQLGIYVINFTAERNGGVQTTTTVTIKVNTDPEFIAPTKLEGVNYVILSGVENIDVVSAQNPDTSVYTSITSASIPSGAVMSPVLPTTPSAVATSQMSWTPAQADFGVHNISFTATDDNNKTVTRNYILEVNTLPVFSPKSDETIAACAAYSYNIVVTDPDIALGDVVEIMSSNLPSWLTLTATGNGTATLSGTPSGADAGLYTITLDAEDTYHHATGVVSQTFVITVSADTTAPEIICLPLTKVYAEANSCGATVTIGTATARDNCGIASITSNAPLDGHYPVGNTIVTWTATDINGNYSTCQQTVTVEDNQAPVWSSSSPFKINNGSIVTHPGSGFGGADASAVLGQTYGYANQISNNNRVADDFVISEANGFTINEVVVYGYQAGSSTTSTLDNVNLRIWNGEPNNGGTIIWGDVSTNRLVSSTFSGIYRVTTSSLTNTQRPIMKNTLAVGGLHLPAGTYWLDWQVGGTGTLPGPWACPNTISGNGKQSVNGGVFSPAYDDGSIAGFPFEVKGNASPSAETGLCGATVNYLTPSASDNCSVITSQTTGLPSGSLFPVGVTTNTFTATDAAGNTITTSFDVTVDDNQAPVITCQANITGVVASSASGAVVNYTTPVGTDNCTGAVTTRIAGLASGATFPIGVTTVTHRVTDAAGLTAECSFTVTVVGVAPVITCPADITLNNAAGQCGANVTFAASETVGIPASVITYSPASGSNFPVGTTTVTATATNAVGSSSCTFSVIVNDVTLPTIVCPSNIVLTACQSTASWTTPTGNDNCAGVAVTQIGGSASGSTFAPGSTTTITYKATDLGGNQATCSFTVTKVPALDIAVTNSNAQLYYGYSADQSTVIKGVPTGGVAPYTVVVTMNRILACNVLNSSGDERWTPSAGTSTGNTCPSSGSGIIPVTTAPIAVGGNLSVTMSLLSNATITVTVTDANGCTVSKTTEVYSEDARCFAGTTTKVKICHRTGNPNNPCVALCINEDAVAAHLAHGDYVGACLPNCATPVVRKVIAPSNLFDVKAYPNPFAENFMINVTSSSQKIVGLKVYDMIGRLIEQREVKVSDLENLTIGDRYPSGVYNILVTQGEELKTLRVVKR